MSFDFFFVLKGIGLFNSKKDHEVGGHAIILSKRIPQHDGSGSTEVCGFKRVVQVRGCIGKGVPVSVSFSKQ